METERPEMAATPVDDRLPSLDIRIADREPDPLIGLIICGKYRIVHRLGKGAGKRAATDHTQTELHHGPSRPRL